MISVVIPVGPSDSNVRWLQDAIDSVLVQTVKPEQVLLINDGQRDLSMYSHPLINVWTPPWQSGVAHSFNYGVALSPTECVLMMGSDDLLEPTCIEKCLNTYVAYGAADAYYWLDVHYMNANTDQSIACNAAMVTKGLWALTGGLPIEASCGAGDAALLSIMMVHLPKLIVQVPSEKPLYLYRDHAETDTLRRSDWMQVIIDIRNLVTLEWKP